jgi:hypothetical protein
MFSPLHLMAIHVSESSLNFQLAKLNHLLIGKSKLLVKQSKFCRDISPEKINISCV